MTGLDGHADPPRPRGHPGLYGTAFRGGRRFFDRPEAEVRRGEATAACKDLGAAPKLFPYAHESLAADEPTFESISAWLDEAKPDVVDTHRPYYDASGPFRPDAIRGKLNSGEVVADPRSKDRTGYR